MDGEGESEKEGERWLFLPPFIERKSGGSIFAAVAQVALERKSTSGRNNEFASHSLVQRSGSLSTS